MTQPNVLVVIMDDLGWGDLACHGNPIVSTPVLDALHADSARLTRYGSGPLCTPARASLLTGRYHHRTRAIDTFCGRAMMDPDEVTLARLFGTHGYRTGGFGKWHLGDAYPMRACDAGFDETLTHNSGGLGQMGDHRDNYWREGEAYFDPVLARNGRWEQHEGYCTDIFTDATIAFIGADPATPFFAYLATNAPHTPLQVGEEFIAPYREAGVNETHARLYGMVTNIDENMGRLLARLDDPALGETIVVYTSDHGPCASARDFSAPPERQQRYNAGLRGEKGSLYEGGIRVPCFWRWPEHITPGVDIDRISSPIDVLPTLASACGLERPSDRVIDGSDLLPLLSGESTVESWVDRTLFMQWHRADAPERYRNYATITQRWKLYRPDGSAVDELYDVEADSTEANDVAAHHPDVVADLRGRYYAWFDDVGSTRPDNYAAPRIIAGSVENPTVLTRQDWRLDIDAAALGELAGWQATTPAHWEIEVEGDAVFDVEVRLERGALVTRHLFDRVCLEIGGSTTELPWMPGVSSYHFDSIALPGGPTEVVAYAAGDADSESWLSGVLGLAGTDRREYALYVDLVRVGEFAR